jgi:hypothetical protein
MIAENPFPDSFGSPLMFKILLYWWFFQKYEENYTKTIAEFNSRAIGENPTLPWGKNYFS